MLDWRETDECWKMHGGKYEGTFGLLPGAPRPRVHDSFDVGGEVHPTIWVGYPGTNASDPFFTSTGAQDMLGCVWSARGCSPLL